MESTLAAVIATVCACSSSTTSAPSRRSNSAIIRTSEMIGTFCITHVSSVSNEAAIIGNTAFLAPGAPYVPRSGCPPAMVALIRSNPVIIGPSLLTTRFSNASGAFGRLQSRLGSRQCSVSPHPQILIACLPSNRQVLLGVVTSSLNPSPINILRVFRCFS